MIPARKSPAFIRWFSRHVEGRMRRQLERVEIRGLDAWQQALAAGPVILVSNHTSWWDVMFCVYLCYRALDGCDPYAMMDADNLRKLPFFARVGAFGVERSASGQGLARESIAYGAGLLTGPGRLVWVFPQGDERPSTLRPLGFRRGAAVIAHAAPAATILPLAFRYELRKTDKPYAYLSLGPPVARAADVDATCAAMEAAVTAELDRIDAHLCQARDPGFKLQLKAKPGRVARLAERILAWRHRRARADRRLP